jgi:hypothetical protein
MRLKSLGHDDFFLAGALHGLVVPDLDLDATILCPAIRGRVARDRMRVARPLERNGLRRQRQRQLEEFGHLAGALSRQAGVVAVDLGQRVGQRLRIGVTDEVQPHVATVAHRVEDLAEPLDITGRNVRDTGLEAYRRHDVRQLDGFELLADNLAGLEPIAGLILEQCRVVRPLCGSAARRTGVARRARRAARR